MNSVYTWLTSEEKTFDELEKNTNNNVKEGNGCSDTIRNREIAGKIIVNLLWLLKSVKIIKVPYCCVSSTIKLSLNTNSDKYVDLRETYQTTNRLNCP
jgi:hypothetical protein